MHRTYIVDTEKENIRNLCELLEAECGLTPVVWRSYRGYRAFLDDPERGVVLIHIDSPAIPGLELTRAATARSSNNIQVVWMAESKAYALDAFRNGVEAFMLMPITGEALRDIIHSLEIKSGTNGIYTEGEDKNED